MANYAYRQQFQYFIRIFIAYLVIGLNDIGIRLYAGGIHDSEGQGWIYAMSFIGLIPSLIMILIAVFRDKGSNIRTKLLSSDFYFFALLAFF